MKTFQRTGRIVSAMLLVISWIICLIVFQSCAGSRPNISVASYNFQYEKQNYHLRSIASNDPNLSVNELVGQQFIAKDYDQDGYIDEVSQGDMSMEEAQKIYMEGLAELSRKDKVREVGPKIKLFQHTSDNYACEIKSFQSNNAELFNQIKVIKNFRGVLPKVIIGIDKKADGSIDELIDGDTSIEEIQAYYSEALKTGLSKNKLIEKDHMIVVK